MDLAFIPSPSRGAVELGPIPLRGYALCIILGVAAAIWIGERRWAARGGIRGTVGDIAVWAVPFGLVGGRLYHVITSPGPYFGDGGNPVHALYVWRGGLGIWGAIALGGVGAWIGARRAGVPLPAFGDAIAPGIAVAQAIGRWGNWFNQELFGKPTTVPWALEIDERHRPAETADLATYHPTFLYESLWCLGLAGFVVWADRRFRLGHGRAFALYVAGYTVGRFWIEMLRVDEAHKILGLRLNVWTSAVVFAGAVLYFVISARRRPGREDPAELRPAGADVGEEVAAGASGPAEPGPDAQADAAPSPAAEAPPGGSADGSAGAAAQPPGGDRPGGTDQREFSREG
jgi:prolipoprotein diacylglyceryl transferase